jgi:hypothetical protein
VILSGAVSTRYIVAGIQLASGRSDPSRSDRAWANASLKPRTLFINIGRANINAGGGLIEQAQCRLICYGPQQNYRLLLAAGCWQSGKNLESSLECRIGS